MIWTRKKRTNLQSKACSRAFLWKVASLLNLSISVSWPMESEVYG